MTIRSSYKKEKKREKQRVEKKNEKAEFSGQERKKERKKVEEGGYLCEEKCFLDDLATKERKEERKEGKDYLKIKKKTSLLFF